MIIAILTIVFLSIISLLGSYRLLKKAGTKVRVTAICALSLLIALYLLFIRDTLYQIYLLPFENTIIWGKWLPILTGSLVGICFGMEAQKLKRVKVMLIVMMLISYLDFGENFFPRPKSKDIKDKWVTIQSSKTTCSPAAVSSMLRLFGIDRNEKEMIKDCLTTYRGTSRQGIWRGLVRNCPEGYKVIPVHYADKKDIQYPILIRATLHKDAANFDQYNKEWGWQAGIPHSVVLEKDNGNGTIRVGDPACGPESWNKSALDVLWDHQGFRIVKDNRQEHNTLTNLKQM